MEETDLVIVGAGPTGLFATFCAGLREINSVTLEVSGTYGGQITELYPQKIVYDMPGILKIKGADLSKQMYEQAVLLNKKILFNSGVTDIIPTDDRQFIIEVNGKQTYKTKAVLLCPGIGRFEPNKLNVEGEDRYKDKGVFYSVKEPSDFKGKKTLIVGGGDSAFDYANQIVDVSAGVVIAQHNNILQLYAFNRIVVSVYADDHCVELYLHFAVLFCVIHHFFGRFQYVVVLGYNYTCGDINYLVCIVKCGVASSYYQRFFYL